MFVVNTLSGERLEVKIERVATEELLHLSKEKYSFDWSLEIDYEVFKLFLIDNNEILGLISIERIPREWRLHVRLLSVSLPNIGKEKVFNGIVDNILDYVATMAINDFGQLACVSLRPNSELAEHYMNKYGLTVTGLFLSIEFPDILQLQNNNDYD